MPGDEHPPGADIKARFDEMDPDGDTDFQSDSEDDMMSEENNPLAMEEADDEQNVEVCLLVEPKDELSDDTLSDYTISDDTSDNDSFDVTTLPSYALGEIHVFRMVREIVDLEPGLTFTHNNVRVMGIYKFGQFKPGYKFCNHYISDRCTGHKILLNGNHTSKFPLSDNIILLFGAIEHKQVRVNDKVASVLYINMKFWNYVQNPDKMESQLFMKSRLMPANFFKQTKSIVPHDVSTSNASVLSDDGADSSVHATCSQFPLSGFTNTMVVNQVELDEKFYYEFERMRLIDIGVDSERDYV